MAYSPITIESVSNHLNNQLPDFNQEGCFHRHLATHRWFPINSLAGRVALTPVCMTLGLTSFLAHQFGFQALARKTAHSAAVLAQYSCSSRDVSPLLRAMNIPREKDIADPAEGICAGSSLYFNYLFSKFPTTTAEDAKRILVQCANLFVEGGGREAVALHNQFGNQVYDLKGTDPHTLTLVPHDQTSSLERGIISYENQNDLKKLANGPHLVKIYNSVGYHALSLVKLSERLCFIFDPAVGLMEFEGEDFPDQIVRFLNQAYRYAHKRNHLLSVRRAGGQSVKASDLKEMHVQVFPMSSGSDLPTFPSVEFKRSTNYYRPGLLQYIFDSCIDSIKAFFLA